MSIFRGSSHSNLFPWDDDDFLKYQVRTTLLSCLDAERLANRNKHALYAKEEVDLSDDIINRTVGFSNCYEEHLARSNSGAKYSCNMLDGKKLEVAIDSQNSIKNIALDGKEDDIWNDAYANLQTNTGNARMNGL